MTHAMPPDPEQILSSIREHGEQFLSAGRRTQLELLETFEQSVGAFADAQEQLAEASDVEWLARLLQAQATLTRDIAGASGKFARQLLEA
jgi:hypothetical protein